MDSFAGYKIKVISWDTRVSNPQDYTSENLEDITEYVPGGGGGTDPACIFDWLKNEGIVPDRLVVFTDGCFFGGDGPKDYCDVAWIIKGNPEFTASHGTWAHFKD
jgi:predicted metal-dependent peptidase